VKKNDIINKIKEVANILGGKTPSLGDMEKYANIKADMWKGKYWVRWSDALIESGYTPNSFSLPKIGKEKITIKLLSFIREIDRLPLFLELKMRKQVDITFPSISAITRNFNGKTYDEIKQELKMYCLSNSTFHELLPFFNEVELANNELVENDETDTTAIGYVYMLRHGSRNEFKIGKTKNILRREGEITIELPELAKPVHYIETDDIAGVEKYWHNRFKEKRKNGEWFNLSSADVQAFKKWQKIF
jgi:hypothetical protein